MSSWASSKSKYTCMVLRTELPNNSLKPWTNARTCG